MDDFLSSNVQDAATPLNSAGTPTQPYKNAAGDFNLHKSLKRKPLSRKDLDQPEDGDEPMRDGTDPQYQEGPLNTGGTETDDATQRYFGSFSMEAKRNVMDLLKTHPMYAKKGSVNLGRVENNTRDKDIMPNDPTRIVENGGYIIYEDEPQASQPRYSNGKINH
jgi:hypothetical protein